jgi:hypothetical protein
VPVTTRARAPVETDLNSGVYEIITPYDADAWESLLEELDLIHKYPNLPNNIRYGFTLGNLPPLDRTIVPPNSKSANEFRDEVKKWAEEEVLLGRLEGPCDLGEIQRRLGGHVQSSSIGVVAKSGATPTEVKFRMVRDFSRSDGALGALAVNDHLDPDDFKTQWGTAPMVGHLVSSFRSACHSAPFASFSMACGSLNPRRHRWLFAPVCFVVGFNA